MTAPNWAQRRTLADSAETESFGRELGRQLRAGDLLVLSGPLGAGKTTLSRGIGTGLGVRGPVTSPTFVLARTHPSLRGGVPLVHVDAYRLSDARELDDLDIDYANSVVVVEWGTGLLDGVSESWLELDLSRANEPARVAEAEPAGDDGDEPRQLQLRGFGPRWTEAPHGLLA